MMNPAIALQEVTPEGSLNRRNGSRRNSESTEKTLGTIFFFLSVFAIGTATGLAQTNNRGQHSGNGEISTRQNVIPSDVSVGIPRPIPYARAFPLLDGIFQDFAAVQLRQLQLDPNAANSSNLNAVLQQLQFSLQYSQTAGIQNSLAAQQAATGSASTMLQTHLITQEAQLSSLQLAAQQQLGKAQAALDFLQSSSTATPDQIAAAKQSLTLATDNSSSITAQLSALKTLLATTATTPSFTSLSPSQTIPSIQAPPLAISPPGGSNFSPSFPASKQMDNQYNLLWERLARLVSTLSQTTTGRDLENTYLVEFHTGAMPGRGMRKSQLLSIQYAVACEKTGMEPEIVDIYPRNAAVNITDQKYKDSRFGLSALLSFFSVGFNAAYNREHLQITQALGQSAYTTGFGIGTKSFGWVFAPALGEDSVAPGDRATFALVSFPQGCGVKTINLVNLKWNKSTIGPVVTEQSDSSLPALKSWTINAGNMSTRCHDPKDCIKRISYTPAEYDRVNPKPVGVTVDLELKTDLDPQETISVGGVFLRRARDNFGRATPSGGSGGLLETTNLDINTWIPVSSREVLLTLDASQFSGRFPAILLSAPNGSIDVMSGMKDSKIDVAGYNYICPNGPASCSAALPAVGRPKATQRRFGLARWIEESRRKHILITLPDTSSISGNQATSGGLPPTQVITESQSQLWSANARVTALQGNDAFTLKCAPLGERLICDPDGPGSTSLDLNDALRLDIFDGEYGGGAVKGSGILDNCMAQACAKPLIWEQNQPQWDSSKDRWDFSLSFINVNGGETVKLDDAFEGSVICKPNDPICQVHIFFEKEKFGLVKDLMTLRILGQYGSFRARGVITNLRTNISPFLTSITSDQTTFTGQNLVFNDIQIGDNNTSRRKAICTGTEGCSLKFGNTDEGYLYFVAAGAVRVPFRILGDKGLQVVPPHPKKPKDQPAKTPTIVIPQFLKDFGKDLEKLLPPVRSIQ